MPDPIESKKIVYLFGAGATHAELANLEKDPGQRFLEKKGLLTANMSKRVMEKFRARKANLKYIKMVSSVSGDINIELYISLIENNKIGNWEKTSRHLKQLVKKDIESILTVSKKKRFYLHKALLELHGHKNIQDKEKLIGLISLNYDDVLDDAYRTVRKEEPNYCFDTGKNEAIPLLKLHGSFDWKSVMIRGIKRSVQIIPLGVNKQFLHIPYNSIWIRALEILRECDILRVVGCSLSQNDTHLIELLFNAHIEKGNSFEIQVVLPHLILDRHSLDF